MIYPKEYIVDLAPQVCLSLSIDPFTTKLLWQNNAVLTPYAFMSVGKAAEGSRTPNAIRVGMSLFLELREGSAWQYYAMHKQGSQAVSAWFVTIHAYSLACIINRRGLILT